MAGTVVNPVSISQAIGSANVNDSLGKSGEILDANIHGKWYTAAYNGKVFVGSALIAGVTLPVNTTTAPTFTLFNPVNSGVNLELITLDIGWPAAATTVVATILGSVSVQTPTSTTSGGAIVTMPLITAPTSAGSGNKAQLFTAATITAITTHIPLVQITSTADAMVSSHYEFDGRVVLGPGSLITLTSTPVQTGVAIPSLCWAEWPV